VTTFYENGLRLEQRTVDRFDLFKSGGITAMGLQKFLPAFAGLLRSLPWEKNSGREAILPAWSQ